MVTVVLLLVVVLVADGAKAAAEASPAAKIRDVERIVLFIVDFVRVFVTRWA